MASAILQEISQDENERALYRSRLMYEMDMFSNKKTLERAEKIIRDEEKWKEAIAEHKAEIADQKAEIARLRAALGED